MPAAGAFLVGWGHEEGDPLNQRQVSRHQSKCRLDDLGGLSSRLNGLRCGMSGMLLAPRKWHPVGPFPRSCSEPKVELFPQISANFVLPRALLQLASWMSASN